MKASKLAIVLTMLMVFVLALSACSDNLDTPLSNIFPSDYDTSSNAVTPSDNDPSVIDIPTLDISAQPTPTPEAIPELIPSAEHMQTTNDDLTYGDTFIFDDLEITFSADYSWAVLKNQFSEYDGRDVIKIPITVKNLKDETHGLNMFYFDIFNPAGTKSDSISSYFMDDDIKWSGDMRKGATLNSFMHILYENDGDYYVEFARWGGKAIEVCLSVKK
ncbi:MAG: hypothetical protein LBI19_03890 [Oscillospiraceae bacterium]|nr:hypothetical protein [Oscillospiraceae bacterium]